MKESRLKQKRSKNKAKTEVCEISQPLRNWHFAANPVRSHRLLSAKILAAAKQLFGTRVPLRSTGAPFRSCETVAKCQSVKTPNFRNQSPIPQGVSQLRNHFWHTSAISQHSDPHFAATKWLRSPKT